MTHPTVFGGATPPPAHYPISNSARFRSSESAYLSRTAGAPTNPKKATISLWCKRGNLTGPGTYSMLFNSGSTLMLGFYNNGGANADCLALAGSAASTYSNAVYRDVSAWYHICLVIDTTLDVGLDRKKIYVNGSRLTAFWEDQDMLAKDSDAINVSGTLFYIGRQYNIPQHFDGYLADFHNIDGQALSPTAFGTFDGNGVWVPIRYTGTFGANGCRLEFKDGAALGADTSGSGNHWTTSGLGSTDQMVDTPTNNYSTLNPIKNTSNIAGFSNGNLTVQCDASGYSCWPLAGMYVSEGKLYWEVTPDTTSNDGYSGWVGGIADIVSPAGTGVNNSNILGGDANSWLYGGSTSNNSHYILNNNVTTTYGPSTTVAGDVVMFALDLDNGKWFIGRNGTWFNSSDPVAGTNPAVSGLAGRTMTPGICAYYGAKTSINFGAGGFAYTPPSGFKALCTANLPAVTIKDPSKHFQTVLYTGNGGTKAVSGMGFRPGFLWGKERSTSRSHFLQNEVVGPQSYLYTDGSGVEAFQHVNGHVQSFDADGFTLTAGSSSALTVNENNGAYVAWGWKGDGSAVTNTVGSLTSQVSANPAAGFSIATFQHTAGVSSNFGHGLGAKPAFVMVKNRDTTNQWHIRHRDLSSQSHLLQFTTSGELNYGSDWLLPTATICTLDGNFAAGNYIAYCFAEIPGYSKFGSYVGNQSIDGVFAYCGFRPRWLMLKCRDLGSSAYDWFIFDTATHPSNVVSGGLKADNPDPEASVWNCVDILSSGFKLRSTDVSFNALNKNFVFAAFAEHPFGGANVAPSPAR